MQIRRVTALIDGEGRDISGNKVQMFKDTSHLVSEVDIEYFLSRPLVFSVSNDVDLVVFAVNELGVATGFVLPNGTVQPLSPDLTAILQSITALQTRATAIEAVNNSQSTLIASLQAAVAALQAGGGTVPTFTIASVSSPSANEGANLVFTIALTGTTQQVQSFAFTVAGTAIANTDYASPFTFSNGVTISGSNLNVPIGVSNFTATTLTSTDALTDGAETVILTIGGVSGTGTISDVIAGGVVWDGGATTWDSGATAWTN